MTNNIITITKVKTPWFLFSFMLKKAFIKSIPEYASKAGLLFKYYHITNNGKTFGGIYLWKDKASADALFNNDWYTQVRKRLKTEGEVAYYNLLESQTTESSVGFSNLKETKSVLIKIHSESKLVKTNFSGNGLLQVYKVRNEENFYAILLFKTGENLKNYIKEQNVEVVQIFDTPVLLKNS
jgi:hypothetical protein